MWWNIVQECIIFSSLFYFGRLGKSSQHSPFRCIHIFSKTSYDQWIFPKKSWKSSLFNSMLVFQLDNLFFFFFLPFSLLAFFLICSLFLFTFFSFLFHFLSFSIFIFIMIFFVYFTYILLDDVPKRRTLHGSRISNIIDSSDI